MGKFVDSVSKVKGDAVAVNTLDGQIRGGNSATQGSYDLGEVVYVPQDLSKRMFKQQIGNGTAQFIVVNVCDAVTHKVKEDGELKRLYLGSLEKSVAQYNADLTPATDREGRAIRIEAAGTAVELYRQADTRLEGVSNLAGHTIRVSKVQAVNTKRFGTLDTAVSNVLTLDISDKVTAEDQETALEAIEA